jgi:hypothetical protein
MTISLVASGLNHVVFVDESNLVTVIDKTSKSLIFSVSGKII